MLPVLDLPVDVGDSSACFEDVAFQPDHVCFGLLDAGLEDFEVAFGVEQGGGSENEGPLWRSSF